MSRNDLLNKNWLANSFRNFCKRNDFPENFVRQSLTNITRVARITNFKKNLDWVALPSKFYFGWLKKKVTQPEIKIKLTTLGSHFNQVKIKNVNHAGNLTAGELTFPRANHAAEQDTLHRDYSPVVFSYSTTTKSTACFCFADGKMDK